MMENMSHAPSDERLKQLATYPLVSALMGRRSRRFAKGAEIKAGPFAYKSKKNVHPLSDLERTLIVAAMAGNTGWNHLIPFNQKYEPKLPNYSGSAGGRTFPSAAGFHTSDLFFTDDSGTYFLSTRDIDSLPHKKMASDHSLATWVSEIEGKIQKISNERLAIPQEEPHIESHNLWVANTQGSLFAFPVVDLAQHMILSLCYLVQNGYGVYDDINKQSIKGLERFGHLIDTSSPYPLSFIEQLSLGEAATEISTSCFSACLLLQAMGLGGWMYNGVDRHSVFGVTGDPRNKGLGFQYDKRDDWIFPNPTGLQGLFETTCPPFYENMRAAVQAVVHRKYGEGGPFNNKTDGPWKESGKIRASAASHSEDFIDCVSIMAQYIYDAFGKFPATLPSAYALMYVQAFHLDTDFYDQFYKPGSYLTSHAQHDEVWHK